MNGIDRCETLKKIETELERIKKDCYGDVETMTLICSILLKLAEADNSALHAVINTTRILLAVREFLNIHNRIHLVLLKTIVDLASLAAYNVNFSTPEQRFEELIDLLKDLFFWSLHL